MPRTASTRWYWSDWQSDVGLRACGLAARGLWKELLCIAGQNEGRDYGFVLIGGVVPDVAELTRAAGALSIGEVESLLYELEKNNVFNRDRRGAIYCRRMVRAEKNRSNGRAGGNPNW